MKIYNLILFVLSFVLFTSCKTEYQPKEVVEKFLYSVDHFKYDDAEKLLVKNSENLTAIENIKKFSENKTELEKQNYLNDKKIYRFEENDKTDSTATIIAINNQDLFTIYVEFNLIKKKGKWLINKFESSN